MTNDEHKLLIQNIVKNIDNQAELTSLLSDLSKDYTEVLAERNTYKKSNETLISDNENLRQTNMKLFLQVGGTEEKIKDEAQKVSPVTEEPTEEIAKYEDLFNEKGELK